MSSFPPYDIHLIEEAKELDGESDRASAIVGSSFLDHLLSSILRKAMIDHKNIDRMFQGYGPLSSFYVKIDMVFFLGLLPHEEIYEDLHKVRDIRNDFAHGHKELSFSEQSIKDRISTFNILKLYRKSLQLDEETENELDEERKAFVADARTPRRMWT